MAGKLRHRARRAKHSDRDVDAAGTWDPVVVARHIAERKHACHVHRRAHTRCNAPHAHLDRLVAVLPCPRGMLHRAVVVALRGAHDLA